MSYCWLAVLYGEDRRCLGSQCNTCRIYIDQGTRISAEEMRQRLVQEHHKVYGLRLATVDGKHCGHTLVVSLDLDHIGSALQDCLCLACIDRSEQGSEGNRKSKGHAPVYESRADKYCQAITDYKARLINEQTLWRRLSERILKSE